MPPVREISAPDAKEWLGRPDAPQLIDCREADEHAFCALPGAELIPLSSFGAEVVERLPHKSEALIIYCHHGVRSRHAAEFLVQQGYENVSNLTGGIDAWAREVDPKVTRY